VDGDGTVAHGGFHRLTCLQNVRLDVILNGTTYERGEIPRVGEEHMP
jgi:hypothetical protein